MDAQGLGGEAEDRGLGDAMEAIWEHHRPEAFARLELLEDAAAALAASRLDPEQRQAAREAAHKLRGSAGTFGRHRASEVAGELEDLLAADGPLSVESAPNVASLVLSLRSELESDPEPARGGGLDGPPGVLLVSDDDELRARLEPAAAGRTVRLDACTSSEASEKWRARRPAIVLLDLVVEGSTEAGLGLLAELARGSSTPVLALAASDALGDRVEAARRGAAGFLDRRLDPATVLDTAERFAADLHGERATVLAVDDDEAVLAALRALLGPRGFTVETVGGAARFWERLDEVAPDLAIVDLDMPEVNGIDLCRAVRTDPRWAGLPLLILTAYRDPELLRQAFVAGADDHISKPIIEEELLGRVRNRLERIRAYREATEHDPLTGVASRPAVRAAIERLVGIAAGAGEPVAVALIDVDHLRELNSSEGIASGDALLRQTGVTLREEFRGDAVGRWDGDQFVIAMNGLGADAAARRVGDLLGRLNGTGVAPATLSAGVAARPAAETDGEGLLAAAALALDDAKRLGGARLAIAGEDGETGVERVDVVIVEDDDSVVDVLQLALDTLGLSSRRFGDGAAAVGELAGRPPRLGARLVLLDWDLPGLDGLSVLRQLAEADLLARTRVIMLTARASEDETLKALELGASDHVSKPFSVPVLVERLRQTLTESEAGSR